MKIRHPLSLVHAAAFAGALLIQPLTGTLRADPAPAGPAPAAEAGNPALNTLLRDALFEEEATRDLTKAAAGYEALLTQWAAQRPTAAAALYRLAEVRRKQDRKPDAIALYQRLLREFPDVEPHAKLARENLTALGTAEPAPDAAPLSVPVDPLEAIALQRVKKLAVESPDLIRENEFPEACGKGWLNVVRFLISKDIAEDGDGFIAAAENGHLAIVKELLPQKPLPEFMGRAVDAATRGNRIAVLKVLLEAGADPDGSSDTHQPLAAAILNNSGPAVELLLEYKADPNPATARISPLYAAASKGSATTVERLLSLGADPNYGGHDPAFIQPHDQVFPNGIKESGEGEGSTPLHAAVAAESPECVKLLLDAKANPNAQNDLGRTPLLGAVEKKNLPLVEQLLAAGANPKMHGKRGELALQLAVAGRHRPIAAALLNKGAELNDLRSDDVNLNLSAFVFDIEDWGERDAWLNLFMLHGADPFGFDFTQIRKASPAAVNTVLRRIQYPALASLAEVTLIYGSTGTRQSLQKRMDDKSTPGALPALLTAWNEKGGWNLPDGGRFEHQPDWSTLRLWRKGADGKMQETVIEVKKDTAWPALQWGDVVEVLAPVSEPAANNTPVANPRASGVQLPPNNIQQPASAIPPETLELLKPAK